MNAPLILGAVWVIAAALTALLPMRKQYVPGVSLLICAPPLIGWIGYEHGLIWLLFGIFALLSMFRRPLLYFARRALGLPVTVPTDFDPPDPAKDRT